MIKRFDRGFDRGFGAYSYMGEKSDGKYVLWEDHEGIVEELNTLIRYWKSRAEKETLLADSRMDVMGGTF